MERDWIILIQKEDGEEIYSKLEDYTYEDMVKELPKLMLRYLDTVKVTIVDSAYNGEE